MVPELLKVILFDAIVQLEVQILCSRSISKRMLSFSAEISLKSWREFFQDSSEFLLGLVFTETLIKTEKTEAWLRKFRKRAGNVLSQNWPP